MVDHNNNIHRSHFANQLNESFIGQKVRIGGWIEDIRDIGRLAFVVVRDVTGAIQAIVTGDNLQLAKKYSKTECRYYLRDGPKE